MLNTERGKTKTEMPVLNTDNDVRFSARRSCTSHRITESNSELFSSKTYSPLLPNIIKALASLCLWF